jgi:hypothetical protein
MNKDHDFMRKIIFRIIVILEIAATLVICYVMLQPRNQISFSASDLLLRKAGTNLGNGSEITASMKGNDRQIYTPERFLDNGIYKVTVFYQTKGTEELTIDDYDSKPEVWSIAEDTENQARYTVESDRNKLHSYVSELSYRIYVHEHSTGVSIQNRVSDESSASLRINKIDIQFMNIQSMIYYLIRFIFWTILIDLIIAAMLFYAGRMQNLFRTKGIILIGLAVILLLLEVPMSLDYVTYGHDITFHCYRIRSIAEGLSEGVFPVKVQPGWMNGYGYCAGVMYGDMFLYFPAAMYAIGFPMHFCYKMYVFLVNLATVILSYLSFRKISGDKYIGLMGSAVYSLSLYRLCDLYSRAAVGEYTAMVFTPVIVLV